MKKHLKPSPAGTSIPSAATPDAALQRLDQLGIAPQIEFGRFPDARKAFGLTRSKIYELIAAGKIKSACIKKPGARHGIRILDLASIRVFLRENTH